MKIVVDTNRIIAALIKDSTTRSIIYSKNFEFITPDYTLTEINEHKNELKSKAGLDDEKFDILLALIFGRIEIISRSDYQAYLEQCKKEINDQEDVPILATAIAKNAQGIWAHDPHFKKQKKVKIFSNIDMLSLNEK